MDINVYSISINYNFARTALFYGGLVFSKNLISILIQCFAVACLMSLAWFAVGVWSGVASFIILVILKRTFGIRVSIEEIEAGLDVSSHSESAYN